jgi:hypothetical protein
LLEEKKDKYLMMKTPPMSGNELPPKKWWITKMFAQLINTFRVIFQIHPSMRSWIKQKKWTKQLHPWRKVLANSGILIECRRPRKRLRLRFFEKVILHLTPRFF